MRVFPLFDSIITDQRTDGPTDKAFYRLACPQLKTESLLHLSHSRDFKDEKYSYHQYSVISKCVKINYTQNYIMLKQYTQLSFYQMTAHDRVLINLFSA